MKTQIKRLSPHQNGKVFGVLMAVTSLVFVVPMFIFMAFAMPAVDQHGNPMIFPKFIIVLFPLFYLIFGYVATDVGSAIYNFLFKYIGGFEFEANDEST
jgi:hypothetical protein